MGRNVLAISVSFASLAFPSAAFPQTLSMASHPFPETSDNGSSSVRHQTPPLKSASRLLAILRLKRTDRLTSIHIEFGAANEACFKYPSKLHDPRGRGHGRERCSRFIRATFCCAKNAMDIRARRSFRSSSLPLYCANAHSS